MELNIKLSESESKEFLTMMVKKYTEQTMNQINTEVFFSKAEFEALFTKALAKAIRNMMRDHFEGKVFTLAEQLFPENMIELLNKKPLEK